MIICHVAMDFSFFVLEGDVLLESSRYFRSFSFQSHAFSSHSPKSISLTLRGIKWSHDRAPSQLPLWLRPWAALLLHLLRIPFHVRHQVVGHAKSQSCCYPAISIHNLVRQLVDGKTNEKKKKQGKKIEDPSSFPLISFPTIWLPRKRSFNFFLII